MPWKMLPLCVIADSDIREEELNSLLIKLKRKRKSNKLKKRAKTKLNLSVEERNNSSDTEKKVTEFSTSSADNVDDSSIPVHVHEDAESLVSAYCDQNFDRNRKQPRKRKRSIRTDSERRLKKAKCVICDISQSHRVKTRQNRTCLCEVGQIPGDVVTTGGRDLNSKVVALDCEFVGVGLKKTSALGRCTIVDYSGTVILDLYAWPEEPITDYRTRWSGIRPKDLISAIPFERARQIIFDLLKDKIVVGHAVFNDFRVLRIHHPQECVRDTGSCRPIRDLALAAGSQGRSLKLLSKALLGRDIQRGEHCSSEDARAALDLYKLVQSEWEQLLVDRATKHSQKTVQSKSCRKSFPDTSYLGDEFWPSDLFEEPSIL